jgi:CRP-like cAMP-binding protein
MDRNFFLFSDLKEDELQRLENICTKKSFKKGNILFFEGDKPKYLYILLKGEIKIFKSDKKGGIVVLHHLYDNNLIAELANLENIPYPATAEFEVDSEVLEINYEIFERDFLYNPSISFKIIKSLSKKIKQLEKVINQNLIMDSTSRVAKFIYENEELFVNLKNNKIASILNLTPETLSRIVRKFKDSNILDENLNLLNKENLKNFFKD